jgi:hypothetical protein
MMWERRPTRIVAFVAVAIAITVALVWVSSITTPAGPSPTIGIADTENLEVDHGMSNAVVFPFQLAPDEQPNEEGVPTVAAASISVTVSVAGCALVNVGPCPGVVLSIYTEEDAASAAAGGTGVPLWCDGSNGSSCAPLASGTFQVDLTMYAGEPLDLLLSTPSGVAWVDLTATGTWSN